MKKYTSINFRISLQFLILLAIAELIVGGIVFHISYSRSVLSAQSLLLVCGRYSSDIIDTEKAKNWLEKGPDDYYKVTENDLRSIKSEFNLSDLFVYKPMTDKDGNLIDKAKFIFDIVEENDTSVRKMELGQSFENLHEYDLTLAAYQTKEPQYRINYTPVGRPSMMLAVVPLMVDSGEVFGVIGLTLPMETITITAVGTTLGMAVVFALLIILFAIVNLLFIRRSIVRPVKLLSNRMDTFVSGGNEFNYTPVTEIHTHDEIEQMTDNFNKMAESIVRNAHELEDAATQHERMRAELDVSDTIRSALSADSTYPAFAERKDFELYASMKNTVYNSCSFCNYYLTPSDHLFIVLGESVGKTLPSLLMSMLASESIRCLAGMETEPFRIAAETNDRLCSFERNDKSMTVCALIIDIDLSDGTMKYVNAGMPPMLIKTAGEPYKAEEQLIQYNLGEMRSVSFTQKTVQLQQGNSLILTSHGISEMRNSSGEVFTGQRLEDEINRISSENYYLNDMIGSLENTLEQFRQGRSIELDTTILGFRYFG